MAGGDLCEAADSDGKVWVFYGKRPVLRAWRVAMEASIVTARSTRPIGGFRCDVNDHPTSGSWLKMVENWFDIIERQAIHRRGQSGVTWLT